MAQVDRLPVQCRSIETGASGRDVSALCGALHLHNGGIILAGRCPRHVDIVDIRNTKLRRVLGAESGIFDVIALINQDRIIGVDYLEIRESDVLGITETSSNNTSGAWVIGEDLDTGTVLSVRHDDVVHVYVLDYIGFARILTKRAN